MTTTLALRLHEYDRFGDPSTFGLDWAYLKGIIRLAGIAGGAGFFVLLAYWIFMCVRVCMRSGRDKGQKRYGTKCWRLVLLTVLVSGGVVTLGSIDGEEHFYSGVDHVHSGLTSLSDVVDDIDTRRLELSAKLQQLQGFDPLLCREASAAVPSVNSVNASLDAFSSSLAEFGTAVSNLQASCDGLADNLDRGRNFIEVHVKQYISALVFIVIAGAAAASCVGIIGLFCKRSRLMGCSLLLTNAIVILFIILVASQLAMSVMLADFCMAPANNTLRLADRYLPEGDASFALHDPHDVASFYVLCTAQTNATVENPVDRSLASASARAVDARQSIHTVLSDLNVTGVPPPAQDLLQQCRQSISVLPGNLSGIITTVDTLRKEVSCSKVHPTFVAVIEDASCDDVLKGFYRMWTVLAAAGTIYLLSLFILTFVRAGMRALQRDDLLDEVGTARAPLLGGTGGRRGSNNNLLPQQRQNAAAGGATTATAYQPLAERHAPPPALQPATIPVEAAGYSGVGVNAAPHHDMAAVAILQQVAVPVASVPLTHGSQKFQFEFVARPLQVAFRPGAHGLVVTRCAERPDLPLREGDTITHLNGISTAGWTADSMPQRISSLQLPIVAVADRNI